MALRINGEYIAEEIIRKEALRIVGEAPSALEHASTQLEGVVRLAEQRVIYRVLLRQMAFQSDIRISGAEVEAERRRRWGSQRSTVCGVGVREAIELDLRATRLRAILTSNVSRPTRLEVERYYLANRAIFFLPERIEVAHIVKNVDATPGAEEKAREALLSAKEELVAGKPFAEVADRYSDCPGVGGSIGWITRGEMAEEFEKVVFEMEIGQQSGVFATVFGLHIATVHNRAAAGIRPLEQVRKQLALNLFEARREVALNVILARAAERSKIQIVPGGERYPTAAIEASL